MANSIKFYSVSGERGFPQHVIRESITASGVVTRTMVATVNNAKHVHEVVDRLNASCEEMS